MADAAVRQIRLCICGGKLVQAQQSRRRKVWVHSLPAPAALRGHRPIMVDLEAAHERPFTLS